MKRCVLLFLILFTSFCPTNGHPDNSLPTLSISPFEYESSTGISSNISHYMILANGMPPSDAEETPPKELSAEKSSDENKQPKEPFQPSEEGKKFIEPSGDDDELDEDYEAFLEEEETINDPMEGYNRAIFKFNDKFYYWILKPVARGYGVVLPEMARKSVRKFFSNAAMPIRLANCALQGRVKGMAIETTRFVTNTTLGVGGLFNPADSLLNLKEQEADFDQTLGRYGMKPVFFINWPLLGPSSLRGTFGLLADTASDPTTYFLSPLVKIGIRSYEEVNETSLTIGDYEALTEPALDPYIAVRNAYYQNRKSKLEGE